MGRTTIISPQHSISIVDMLVERVKELRAQNTRLQFEKTVLEIQLQKALKQQEGQQ